ncbi:Uncharacterized protein QTN25_001206 [Entamoeba marina]
MKLQGITKFIVLFIVMIIIYIPTYYVFDHTIENQLLHTSITFIISLIACLLVAYYADKEDATPTTLAAVAPQSLKSKYIQNLPNVVPHPKDSICPTNSEDRIEDLEKKEAQLIDEIEKKKKANLYESDQQTINSNEALIKQLETNLENTREALKVRKDFETNRISKE